MSNLSLVDQLTALLIANDASAVREFVERLSPSDAPHVLSRLSAEARAQVLATLPPEEAAGLVQELPLALSAAMIEDLPPEPAAAILDELPSDEQTDLLAQLEPDAFEAVLARMDPEEVADVQRLRGYPSDTAGGLMVTEYLAYPATTRVADVLHDLRARADDYARFDVQYVYVVSEDGVLVGVARLRDLLFLADTETLSAAMFPAPAALHVDASLDEMRRFFDDHNFLAAPILDEGRRLVGAVTRSAVEEAAVEQAEQNFLRFSGIMRGEEFRTMPLRTRVAGRLAWLAVTMFLSFVAASVVGAFRETLAATISLAVFLPVISGMSGNAGNQAIAVTLRELTLGLLKPHELGWVILKEAAVGALIGLTLGLVLAVAAWVWQGNPYLGLVVGVAQALSVLAAACLGGTIPLVIKRLGFDPALAAAPVLTTITDATGFFLALAFATLLLSRLT